MNSFETLFFPETDIYNERFYPLLLFFTPLIFLQVVEHGPSSVNNAETNLFQKSGLCKAYVPSPLGENREQFLRLVRDINEQKEHLVDRLRGVTIDSSPAPTDSEPLDVNHQLVSSLLQEYGVKHGITAPHLQIWQARLVLVIAEILDSNEDSLQEDLFFFNEEEIAAFRSLQEKTDSNEGDLFSEVDNIKQQLEKSRLRGGAKRFNAWRRLQQNQPIPSVEVWLASTRDSADQIFNRYESTSNAHAVPLLKLAVPARITASDKYVVEEIEKFQQATAHIHRGLVADFERIVRTVPYVHDVKESLLPFDTDWANQWEGAVDDFFPASSNGRNDITFYLLPDQPIARVLSLAEYSGASYGETAHGLLAVLGTPQTI